MSQALIPTLNSPTPTSNIQEGEWNLVPSSDALAVDETTKTTLCFQKFMQEMYKVVSKLTDQNEDLSTQLVASEARNREITQLSDS